MKWGLLFLAGFVVAASAEAAHPRERVYRADPLERLAYDLEVAAARVHRSAELQAHHFTREEAKALRRLHELDKRARHFRAEVSRRGYDRYRRYDRNIYRDFEKLDRELHKAERDLYLLHAYPGVYRDFRRVQLLVDEIAHHLERGIVERHVNHGYIQVYARW